MKAILAIALIAVAASAFDLNAYHTGFTQQFGFTEGQVQDGYTCFIGVGTIINSLKASAQAQDIIGLIQTLQGAKVQLLQACGPYFADFQAYAIQHATTEPRQALNQYFPQIVQAVAQWADYIAQGQDEQAGQQEAYILQVLIGAQTPAALQLTQVDFSKYVPFDQTTFFNEYLTAFFNTLGLKNTETVVAEIQQCVNAIIDQTPNFQNFEVSFANGDFDGKIDALQALADNIFATIKNCQGPLDLNLYFLEKVFVAFREDPVTFVLTLVNNVALNLPQIIENVSAEQADVIEGQYAAAGTLKAQDYQIVYKNLVDFAN
jgi:hypothetical protein